MELKVSNGYKRSLYIGQCGSTPYILYFKKGGCKKNNNSISKVYLNKNSLWQLLSIHKGGSAGSNTTPPAGLESFSKVVDS